MNRKYIILVFVVLGIAILLIAFLFYPRSPYAKGTLDGFAQCLSSKGIKMYGAYWCPHCQNQKAAFGDSFKYVNYVECTQEVAACESAGVVGYPTWVFPDGRRLEGEQKLEDLSSASGCALPGSEPSASPSSTTP